MSESGRSKIDVNRWEVFLMRGGRRSITEAGRRVKSGRREGGCGETGIAY